MAEQNLDPELVERVNRELATMGQLSAQTAEDLRVAQVGVKNFQQKINAAGGALGSLADAFVTYNKEVYRGSSANQAAAASMDKLGEAARYAGAFLALITPGGPLVKALVAGLGLLAGKMTEAGKEIALQTDQVYKAYQDLAKAGAAGAGGMQDVFNGLQKVGLGTEKFASYLKLVNENSQDLARFGGTLNQGRKLFENTMGSFTREQRVQMEVMGLDREAQAEATMNYIKQQRQLTIGTREQMNTSSAAVMRYIHETDALARITGINRKEQEKLVEKALRKQAFAAKIDELTAQGRMDEVNQLKQGLALMQAAGEGFADAYMDSVGGFGLATEAGRKGFMSTNGELQNFVDTITSSRLTQEQVIAAFQRVSTATNQVYDAYGRQAASMSNMEGTLVDISSMRGMIRIGATDMTKALQQAGQEALDQAANSPTLKMAEAENAVRETQLELQRVLNSTMDFYIEETRRAAFTNRDLVFKTGKLAAEGVQELETAFGKLVKAMEPLVEKIGDLMKEHVLPALIKAITKLAEFVNKITRAKTTEEAVQVSGELGVAETVGGIGMGLAGAKTLGTMGAAFGTAVAGPVGAAVGAAVGATVGGAAGYFGGSAVGRAADAAAQGKGFMDQMRAMFNMGSGVPPGGVPPGQPQPDFRAAGGPVSARTPYIVGEEGPELFVPTVAGDIVPTDKLKGTTGAALRQSQAIEAMINRIVLDTSIMAKIADSDADRTKAHSQAIETMVHRIELDTAAMMQVARNSADRALDHDRTIKDFYDQMAVDALSSANISNDDTIRAKEQSQTLAKIVNRMVADTATMMKITVDDADRTKDYSQELKTQREKIERAIKDIAGSSLELEKIYKLDLRKAQDYSAFYKKFIDTKMLAEQQELDIIEYRMTETGTGLESATQQAMLRFGQRLGVEALPATRPDTATGLKMPAAPAASGMGGAQGLQALSQNDLIKMGLKIKQGDVQAQEAGISPRLIELAKKIQEFIPGFSTFTGFNDRFHQEKAPSSQHTKGLALDFTLAKNPSAEDGKAITDWLRSAGASLAIDEYNNPSSQATGGHIHAQIPAFEDGGTLGAGRIGIAGEGGKPELITGPADITPMNELMRAFGNMTSLLEISVNRLEAIAKATAATSDTSTRMLSYAQN